MSGSCIALSDGSVKDGMGPVAWVLEGSLPTTAFLATATSRAQRAISAHTVAYCVYTLALAIRLICEHHGIADGSVELCCDGLASRPRPPRRAESLSPPRSIRNFELRNGRQIAKWTPTQRRSVSGCTHLPIPPTANGAGEFMPALDSSHFCSDAPLAMREVCSTPPAKAYWLEKGRFGTGSPSNDQLATPRPRLAIVPIAPR
jgi:hypothetical protein